MSEQPEQPGPTGDYPQGKLNESDEGGLNVRVSHDEGKVIIDFGVAVEWIGLDPQGAADFASAILQHAREAGNEVGVLITITLPAMKFNP